MPGPHLQTIWPSLIRRQVIPVRRRERLALYDGDFIDLDWLGDNDSGPIVVLLHGLTGCSHSNYIVGLQKQCLRFGWQSVAVNFRGCSGSPNLLPRSYHSGDSQELQYIFTVLRKRYPVRPIAAVGYSLGGNVLLKYLGEQSQNSILSCAVAVSVPFRLDLCAEKMNRGFSRTYRNRLIRAMLQQVYDKIDFFRTQGMEAKAEILESFHGLADIKTFQQFDHQITAPLHGFRSGDDYYRQASSCYYLDEIRCPTLILHAKDDPFMTADCIPSCSELSKDILLEVYENGGHVGFVCGTLRKPEYWLEQKIPAFLRSYFPVSG